MLSREQQAILTTLKYFDQFNFPLSFNELRIRLPFKISKKKLQLVLKKLIEQKKIIRQKNCYCLAGREKVFNIRFQRKKITLQKEQEAVKILNFVQKLPFIVGVAYTGSMAACNADKKADLDFLIVTKRNRLWLARFLVLIFASLQHRRPKLGKKITNQWDFNLWLEEGNLEIPVCRQSLYEVYELLQVRWLIDKANLANLILQKNVWLKKFVPNLVLPKICSLKHSQIAALFRMSLCSILYHVVRFWLATLQNIIFSFFNSLLYFLQKIYRSLFYFSDGIKYRQAFFHLAESKQNFLSAIRQIDDI